MKKITKAVIPVAGMGTRLLPATKAIPKEMLPILDAPTIQHIIQEAIESGITHILLVTSTSKKAIIDHFKTNPKLESFLKSKNKLDLISKVKDITKKVTIDFVNQKKPLGLGHAIYCAKNWVGKDPFAVLLGDDIIVSQSNKPRALKQCIDAFNSTQCSVVGVQKVEPSVVVKCGIVAPTKPVSSSNNVFEIKNLVEKPTLDKAPSDFAILGRYALSNKIFSCLEKTKKDKSGEIQITDAIKILLSYEKVCACNFSGKRYDIGNKLGYVIANVDFALNDAEISEDVKKHLSNLVKTWKF